MGRLLEVGCRSAAVLLLLVLLGGCSSPPQGGSQMPEGKAKVAILIHMLGSSPQSWKPLEPALDRAGISYFAVSLRAPPDYQGMVEDGREAYRLVREKNPAAEICLVGASIGANIATIIASENDGKVGCVVLLSPGEDYRGVAARWNYSAPTLLIASSEDAYSASSSAALAAKMPAAKLEIYGGLGHGTGMLLANGTLAGHMAAWISENVG